MSRNKVRPFLCKEFFCSFSVKMFKVGGDKHFYDCCIKVVSGYPHLDSFSFLWKFWNPFLWCALQPFMLFAGFWEQGEININHCILRTHKGQHAGTWRFLRGEKVRTGPFCKIVFETTTVIKAGQKSKKSNQNVTYEVKKNKYQIAKAAASEKGGGRFCIYLRVGLAAGFCPWP